MKLLRVATGILFILTGSFKLLAIGAFGDVLAQSGVPLPKLFAVAVPVLEVGGGASLLAGRYSRVAAVLLAANMLCAIALVGLPTARGEPFQTRGLRVGGEPWRLPLEMGLLISLVTIAATRGIRRPASAGE